MIEPVALSEAQAAFVHAQRVARLATADARGRPHVVPVCYAWDEAHFYTPLDEKPKRTDPRRLRRVRNLAANPQASLLVDHYEDDWSRLGYVLAQGTARLAEPGEPEHTTGVRLLRERYPPYQAMALDVLPLIVLTPERISAWGPAVEDAAGTVWTQPGRGLDFLPLARGRRSVRRYQERAVPREALETMLDAARWAPSPHGRQPWRFAVLTRPERKAQLAAAMGEEWQRTLEMDGEPAATIAERLARSHERIRTAPALILACLYLQELDRYPDPGRQQAEATMAIQSLGAAVQNLLLAAYSLGLDTGWMCAPLFCPETVRAALGLPAALIPHALLTVGYAAGEPRRRPHRPASELVVLFD
jgi:coenzyme F420-0:L-glutamate ligase/coenzyme F420-1:gamma-L-glutamate ligase